MCRPPRRRPVYQCTYRHLRFVPARISSFSDPYLSVIITTCWLNSTSSLKDNKIFMVADVFRPLWRSNIRLMMSTLYDNNKAAFNRDPMARNLADCRKSHDPIYLIRMMTSLLACMISIANHLIVLSALIKRVAPLKLWTNQLPRHRNDISDILVFP